MARWRALFTAAAEEEVQIKSTLKTLGFAVAADRK